MSNSEIKAPELEMRDLVIAAAEMLKNSATGQVLFSDFYKQFGIADKRQKVIFSLALRDYRLFKIKTAGNVQKRFAYIGELPPRQVEMQLHSRVQDAIDPRMLEKWATACEAEIAKTFQVYRTCGVKSSDLKDKVCAQVLASISEHEWVKVAAELRRRGCVTKGNRSRTWTVGPNHPAFQETSND